MVTYVPESDLGNRGRPGDRGGGNGRPGGQGRGDQATRCRTGNEAVGARLLDQISGFTRLFFNKIV